VSVSPWSRLAGVQPGAGRPLRRPALALCANERLAVEVLGQAVGREADANPPAVQGAGLVPVELAQVQRLDGARVGSWGVGQEEEQGKQGPPGQL
jgi:hypothetical protein